MAELRENLGNNLQGGPASGRPGLRELIERALPRELPFYHLGLMRLEPAGRPEVGVGLQAHAGDQHVLAYALSGDLSAVVLLLVDRGLDLSTYAEAGNVLASRVATELARSGALDIMVSPPLPLAPSRLGAFPGPWILDRTYLHLHQGVAATVRLLVALTGSAPGVAHA